MSWINLKLITATTTATTSTTTEMNQLKTNYNCDIVATAGDENKKIQLVSILSTFYEQILRM